MAKKFFYGTGRRKTSSARVFLMPGGTGKFTVKSVKKLAPSLKKDLKKGHIRLEDYFVKKMQIQQVLSPLEKLQGARSSYDVFVTVKGGGFSGQAGAMRHGLARALLQADESHRKELKTNGFLTRDPRTVERKKYGHHKARKSPQFSKR